MRRFPLFRSRRAPAPDDAPSPNDPLARELRALYTAPPERYWDDLEARILQAVRTGAQSAGRAAPAAVEWWQALARWSRPGLAAAAVLVAVVSAVGLQARGAHLADAAAAEALEPLDPEFARAIEQLPTDSASAEETRTAREATELLRGGLLKRRPPLRPEALGLPALPEARTAEEALRARREATFRYVMPD